MSFHRLGLPTEAAGDVGDGKASGAESNGCGDSIGVRDQPFDVGAQMMCGVGVSPKASGLHDLLDIFAGQKMEGARVVAAEDAGQWDSQMGRQVRRLVAKWTVSASRGTGRSWG